MTNLPKYDKKNDNTAATNGFEEAVFNTFIKLSPVVADGITTENLTMVRTRFLMDWYQQKYNEKYPFTLFSRQDRMTRDGYFDIYNQWMFGKLLGFPMVMFFIRSVQSGNKKKKK